MCDFSDDNYISGAELVDSVLDVVRKESESCDYFGLWNVIDLTYIVLNLSIMFMTFFQQDDTLEA